MGADEGLIRRWRANAAAAGIKLTDDDIARIDGRGQLERIRTVEAIIQRADVGEIVPDYLGILATQPRAESGERSDG